MKSISTKLFHISLLHWKIVWRTKPVLFLLLFSLGYIAFIFYAFLFGPDAYAPADALAHSYYIVQGGILAAVFLGIQLVRYDDNQRVHEIISSIYQGNMWQTLGKALFFLSLLLGIGLFSLLILWGMYFFTGLSFSSFYIGAAKYIVLYWLASFLIGGMIGALLAIWVKGNLIYPLVVFIWLSIGPVNYWFISWLAILLNLDFSYDIIDLLNIGQNDPHYSFHPLYGFPLEVFQWLKKALWICMLLTLFSISMLIKQKKKSYVFLSIGFILLLIPVSIGLNQDQQVLHFGQTTTSVDMYDPLYYEEYEGRDIPKQQGIVVDRYQIRLDTYRNLTADVALTVQNDGQRSIRDVHFLLYHDLTVRHIDHKGDFASFEQQADNVFVTLNDPLDVGEETTIRFTYEGTSSPFFFANELAVYLPNYFPWIPVIREHDRIMTDYDNQDAYRLPLQPDHQAMYSLEYKGPEPAYVTLPQRGENLWQGESEDGITIISGNVKKEIKDDTALIYPLHWERSTERFSDYKAYVQDLIETIQKDFNLSREFHIKEYAFFPAADRLDEPEQRIWINSYQMTVSSFGQHAVMNVNDPFLTYGLVPALTWKAEAIIPEDIRYVHLFDASYAYWLNCRMNIQEDDSYFEFLVEYEGYWKDQQSKETVMQVLRFIENREIDETDKRAFFRKWYTNIQEGRYSWSDIAEWL